MSRITLLGLVLTAAAADPTWKAQLAGADQLRDESRFSEADAAYRSAIHAARQIGPDSFSLGITLNNYGFSCHRSGRLVEAEQNYLGALRIVGTRLGYGDPTVVKIVVNLSNVYLELNQISKAASFLRLSLTSGGNALQSADRALLLGNLGSALSAQGDRKGAEAAFREALAIFDQTKLPEARENAVIAMSNLAGMFAKEGRLKEALELSERAKTLLDEIENPSGSLLVRTLTNVAILYTSVGRLPEAEQLFQRATEMCTAGAAPDRYLLGYIFKGHAKLLNLTDRRAESKLMDKRADRMIREFQQENLVGHTIDVAGIRPTSRLMAGDTAKRK